MNRELISKTTRNEFREVLVGFVLREIEMIFEAGGLEPRPGFVPQVSGLRRGLVEAYYANIDFQSPAAIRKLLLAYEEVIGHLRQTQDKVINPESVEETIKNLLRRLERDGYQYENGRFISNSLNLSIVQAPSLVQLTEASIIEHVEKARYKIEAGDSSGAIANAYTLVEDFLKQLLRRTGTRFNESEGDIRALYRSVAGVLNLEPKGDRLENHLKAILEGLQRQITFRGRQQSQ